MGLIYSRSGIASKLPRIANAFMGMKLMKGLAGVAPEREMPRFAMRTFRELFGKRQHRKGGRRVVLWADTFNNHFLPGTAMAAAEVLELAGYEVVIPRKRVCCGRPLYDWGFLGRAKALLRETLEVLREELDEGLPVVGLEPSCVSVFRDELPNLMPDDPYAQRLAASAMTLSEFIVSEGENFRMPPPLRRRAIVQAHCHHKSVMKFDAEEAVLRQLGLDLTHPDSGCCGMAGAFGFEEKNYAISMQVGERVLLPLVREAEEDVLVIANGFSCREQIEQGTGRKTLHFAEVLRMAYEAERS
jgi:Fe-S oxidoreductase